MASLTDTELRVALVVLRQTVGRGKARDWLARSLMVARTGRSPDAVSRATDSLVRNGILIVEDAGGRIYDTPKARRAARAPLYFRPGRKLITAFPNLRVTSYVPTGINNINPVVTYVKTPPDAPIAKPDTAAVPDWFQETASYTLEETIQIDQAKERIRQNLRRFAGSTAPNA